MRILARLGIAVAVATTTLSTATGGSESTGSNSTLPAASERPNIVLIMSDDGGFSDLGCYGGEIETPNLDRIAERGLRFRDFYTNGKCSPTRAALLTGRYSHRVGVGDVCDVGRQSRDPSYLGHLSTEVATLPELLRSAGYQTFMSGKWHLGGTAGTFPGRSEYRAPEHRALWPLSRGFDRFFGLIGSEADYFGLTGPNGYWYGDVPFEIEDGDGFYATDAFTDYALEFLDGARASSQPFFLYLPYTAPHKPHHAPQDLVDRYLPLYTSGWGELREARYRGAIERGVLPAAWSSPGFELEDYPKKINAKQARILATHAAMVHRMDENVGRIYRTLEEWGELERTLFVFLSDNGAAGLPHSVCNAPFRGYKGLVLEGSLRTHCIVHWPAGLGPAPGSVTDATGHVMDWMPTLADLAGVSELDPRLRDIDGENLAPLLRGEDWERCGDLFWEYRGRFAARVNGWKLSLGPEDPTELHNLELDGTETHNLIDVHPRWGTVLRRTLGAWAARCGVLPSASVEASMEAHKFELRGGLVLFVANLGGARRGGLFAPQLDCVGAGTQSLTRPPRVPRTVPSLVNLRATLELHFDDARTRSLHSGVKPYSPLPRPL